MCDLLVDFSQTRKTSCKTKQSGENFPLVASFESTHLLTKQFRVIVIIRNSRSQTRGLWWRYKEKHQDRLVQRAVMYFKDAT